MDNVPPEIVTGFWAWLLRLRMFAPDDTVTPAPVAVVMHTSSAAPGTTPVFQLDPTCQLPDGPPTHRMVQPGGRTVVGVGVGVSVLVDVAVGVELAVGEGVVVLVDVGVGVAVVVVVQPNRRRASDAAGVVQRLIFEQH